MLPIGVGCSKYIETSTKLELERTSTTYGILAVRKDCSTFSPVQLSQNNGVATLRAFKNKPILLQNFEAYQGEFTLKDIQEDMIHVRDIERLKKTCTEPFDRYVK